MADEMLAQLVAVVSAMVAIIALGLTLWQNILTRRAVQAQTMLTLEEFGKEAQYRKGIAALVKLKSYPDYASYCAAEPIDAQEAIYDLVEFLNFAAHLVDERFLHQQTVWSLYFWAYRIAGQKLLPWWVEGIRAESHPARLATFERMSQRVLLVTDSSIRNYDIKRSNSR